MRRAFAVVVLALAVSASHAQRQPGWEVRIPERVEVALGETGTLPINIAVDRGLGISKDAPVIVDLVVPAGVTVRKPRLGRGDAVDPEADAPRFVVPLKTTAAGEGAASIRIRMWLCGGRSCRPLDIKRQVAIVVAAPAPPPPPADAGVPDAPVDAPRRR